MRTLRTKPIAALTLAALMGPNLGLGIAVESPAGHDGQRGDAVADIDTTSPIKHVIVIIGENRTFDNLYATYVPKHDQRVANLLSLGIVDKNGAPGPKSFLAEQSRVSTISPVTFFIDTNKLVNPGKLAYALLPTPEAGGAPPKAVTLTQFNNDPVNSAPPFDAATFSRAMLETISPVLEKNDLDLLTTGATGLSNCQANASKPPVPCAEPDTRVANFDTLPNTTFQITGRTLKYDSYTGDMVHRFFHMWQQSDCDIANATFGNPSGCLNDLYPFVGIGRKDDSGGNSMGFYNVQKGDAPLFKHLADEYTMSDNYHQPVMGGTAVQHTMMMTGDGLPWEHVGAFPAVPPPGVVADPTPKSATDVGFKVDGRWTQCDPTSPSNKPIFDYLKSLPWRPDLTASNCKPGTYYMINNLRPGFLSNGALNTAAINAGTAAPPSSLRTIGDALNEKHVPWAYYGGGFNAARRFDNGSTDPVDVLIGTGGDWYCDICNSFQYSASIMGDPVQRAAHIKDFTDFFDDVEHGQLPAVSYLKPDSFDDGHPASSKAGILEALIDHVIKSVKSHEDLFKSTAIFVTFDEGGGYWDSGFFQPIDFFGDGPRIPFIVVSPYSRGGRIVHSYGDHASVLKFIERNWELKPLTSRSRDNLPNPISTSANPYVPVNMPALGDLFDMFDFAHHDDQGH
jgi:phospholipase C